MALVQAENKVTIEGILNSVDVKTFTSKKNGKTYAKGNIEILVEKDNEENVIPVEIFVSELTNAGKPHPGYTSVMNLTKDFTSIAACGNKEMASKIAVRNASLVENAWIPTESKDNAPVSNTNISANFFDHVVGDVKPKATFSAKIIIVSINDELNREGEMTGRLLVNGVMIQYGGKADLLKFVVESPEAVRFISTKWAAGDTVRVAGKVRHCVVRETTAEETGFGEPIISEKTRTVKEYVITSGSAEVMSVDEGGYDQSDVSSALADRKNRLMEDKKRREAAKDLPKSMSNDLTSGNGFSGAFGVNGF